MTNAELIAALRNCSCADGNGSCAKCAYKFAEFSCKWKMMRDAADALEAADKKIEQLEKQVVAHEKLVKRCGKQMRKMERENDELQDKLREKIIILQRTKEGYVDG